MSPNTRRSRISDDIDDIIPGASGTVFLPHIVGRARALEIITEAALLSAEKAER
ncbi:hypothetical protein OIN60_15535 [Paenibacillus sp. P96]|uniref:Uncharacterized protein n=1 Tax=Paenibacillus zeirhizosphaerae TaxID=2987519 RepID=A0ABT9FU00_9BACL|nr:hypothetical protein [Paenibacillus sp. P96]MDP4098170.1 hypothetical protein [Paenibacillus sp. P96]